MVDSRCEHGAATPDVTWVDLSCQPRSAIGRLRRHWDQARQVSFDAMRYRRLESLQLHYDRQRFRTLRSASTRVEVEAPLVTIRISTYGHRPDLVYRAVAGALAQTYDNIEVLVTGELADEATAAAAMAHQDARVRFVNLPREPAYPERPAARWLVGGYAAGNLALELSKGQWIAPLDDDDDVPPDHVEVLLRGALEAEADLVHSRTAVRIEDKLWAVIGRPRLTLGHVSHGSVLYSRRLAHFRYSGESWRINEPYDWNMWRRMSAAGARIAFVDAVTYLYYPSPASATALAERSQKALRRGTSVFTLPPGMLPAPGSFARASGALTSNST